MTPEERANVLARMMQRQGAKGTEEELEAMIEPLFRAAEVSSMTPEERAKQLTAATGNWWGVDVSAEDFEAVIADAIRAAEQDALARVVDIAALQATIENATAEIERLRAALRLAP